MSKHIGYPVGANRARTKRIVATANFLKPLILWQPRASRRGFYIQLDKDDNTGPNLYVYTNEHWDDIKETTTDDVSNEPGIYTWRGRVNDASFADDFMSIGWTGHVWYCWGAGAATGNVAMATEYWYED